MVRALTEKLRGLLVGKSPQEDAMQKVQVVLDEIAYRFLLCYTAKSPDVELCIDYEKALLKKPGLYR